MNRHAHAASAAHLAMRQQVRQVACPTCGAPPGQKCLGKTYADGSRYIRAASHAARWQAWRSSQAAGQSSIDVN
jgi:formate dehydrogenase maturation protein FdhE